LIDATGVLLVGGLSRRFGSIKALAPLGSETLAERAWRTLGEAFQERIAVGKGADQLGLPFPVLDDGIDVRAPIAGVVAGLRAAETEIAVFLPVDCPLITPEALVALAEACADAAVPAGRALPGAYRQTVLPVLEDRLMAGELPLHDALEALDTRVVDLDGRVLANVNTQRELDRLRALTT
jgi:molybdopterin-guanine dinucleotide biosynthesis protein A